MAIPKLTCVDQASVASTDSGHWDAVIVVSPTTALDDLPFVQQVIETATRIDACVGKTTVLIPAPGLPGGRLILSPTGPLGRDHDDVRRFADASRCAIVRAREAGARKPLMLFPRVPMTEAYARAVEVSLLEALAALWEPIEARESGGGAKLEPLQEIGFWAAGETSASTTAAFVGAIEQGRRLARDICGAQPERMGPMQMASACSEAFAGSAVQVQVLDDVEYLRGAYPLMMTVARGSLGVERHRPCVIRLEYNGEGPIRETLLFAGKGLTYDTGGHDLKTGGHMAGMSRDKGGAAAVAGFMRVVALLKPKGLRVIAEIGALRNSIGPDAFVTDEIIVSHAGVRVRIGNTDAEGRLVLADLLSHLREQAKTSPNPRIYSVATLTGHSCRAVGPYTIALDNGPAMKQRLAMGLAILGDIWGEPVEVSRLRREDFDFVSPRSSADDLLSCNNEPSSMTDRGHQFPMAFLTIASGLDHHAGDSKEPLCYSHIDLGGSAMQGGDWQHGRPTAAPIVALAARWLIES